MSVLEIRINSDNITYIIDSIEDSLKTNKVIFANEFQIRKYLIDHFGSLIGAKNCDYKKHEKNHAIANNLKIISNYIFTAHYKDIKKSESDMFETYAPIKYDLDGPYIFPEKYIKDETYKVSNFK